jgi:hypothetical protein
MNSFIPPKENKDMNLYKTVRDLPGKFVHSTCLSGYNINIFQSLNLKSLNH